MKWTKHSTVFSAGSTLLIGADPLRTGLRIFPGAGDIYISTAVTEAGDAIPATTDITDGMDRVLSTDTKTLDYLDEDAPASVVYFICSTPMTVIFHTRTHGDT